MRTCLPFTVTMVIAPSPDGELLATASLSSDCVRDTVLHVSFEGSKVVLAGSDSDGNSITFRGALDSSTTVLQMGYILNGSASGRCELDEGDGSMESASPSGRDGRIFAGRGPDIRLRDHGVLAVANYFESKLQVAGCRFPG